MPSAGKTISLRAAHEANLKRLFKNNIEDWIIQVVSGEVSMQEATVLFTTDVILQTIKDLPPREKAMVVGLVRDWDLVARMTSTVDEVNAFARARGWDQRTTEQAMRDAIALRAKGSRPSRWGETAWETDIDRMARNIATASDAMAIKYKALAHNKSLRWISKRDDKVRQTHDWADGQTIRADSYFVVGGYLVEFPGDPSAPPQERINCRCVLQIVDPVTGRPVSDAELERETEEALQAMAAERTVVASLTAGAPNQARILKGNPDGGQWTDTPHSIMLHNIAVEGPEAALAYLQEHPEDRDALMAEVRAEGQRQRDAEDAVRARMEPEEKPLPDEEADLFPDDIDSDDSWLEPEDQDGEGEDPFGDDLMWQDKSIEQINGQDLYEMTAEAIEGPLREYGITIIDNGSGGDLGDAYMSLKLIGPEGEYVGRIERAVSADGVVENQLFELTPDWQGKGIASKLTPAMEDMWRSKGYTEVVVHANIDVGGYTWARQGFKFANSWEVEGVLDRVGGHVPGWDSTPGDRENPFSMETEKRDYDTWNEMDEVYTRWENGDILPAEIAGIGYDPEWPGSWPGKEGMLGSDWQGYKELDPFGESGPAYSARTLTAGGSPAQARVQKGNRDGGQWIDTPSSVLADLGWTGERDDIFADRDTYFVPDTEHNDFDQDYGSGRDIATVLPSPTDTEVFTDEERDRLNRYTGSYAEYVNQNLRHGMAGDSDVRDIDSAMGKSKLAEDATLFRMVHPIFWPDFSMPENVDQSTREMDSLVGKVLRDRAYLSTSTNEEPDFAAGEGYTKLVINAPKGTDAINMKPISNMDWENEVLLPRDTPLAITGWERDSETGDLIVHMTVAEKIEESLTAAAEKQARILKGNPGGGQWVDTPSAILDGLGWKGEGEGDFQEKFTTPPFNATTTDPMEQETRLNLDADAGSGATAREEAAVQWYTHKGDWYINHLAREGEEWDGFIDATGTDWLGEAERASEAMDGLISRSPTPHDLFTYRGVGKSLPSDPAALDSLIGKVISDPGFLSTSLYPEVAQDFVTRGNPIMPDEALPPILRIKVPKGTGGIWADPISLNQGEAELILGQDTPLAIEGWHRNEYGFPVIDVIVAEPIVPEIPPHLLASANPSQARIRKGQPGGGRWTETPSGVMDDLRANRTPEENGQMLRDAVTGPLAEYGLTAKTVRDTPLTGAGGGRKGTVSEVDLLDENGRRIGGITRTFYEDGTVGNDIFGLNRDWQGKGIGSALTTAMEEEWRSKGYDTIELHANLDVGGFTWARLGFEYADRRTAYHHAYDVWSRMEPGPAKDEASALMDSARGNPRDPAPFLPADLVGIGWQEGTATWPGKEASLGTGWDGIKHLNPVEPVTASAAQARAPKGSQIGGQWIDTPSAVLADMGTWSGEDEGGTYFVPDVDAGHTTGGAVRDALPDPNGDDFDFGAALALGHYSSDNGKGINDFVRDGGLEKGENGFLSGVVKDLDGGFEGSHTTEDALFYRGLDGSAFGGDAHIPDLAGKVIRDKGYLSTTTDDEIAYQFAGWKNPVIMEIKVPAGTPAIKVGGDMALYGDRESEVLFPRDLPIAITGVENLGGEWRIKATVGERVDDALTAAGGPSQARILKGNPDGGQWTETPNSILRSLNRLEHGKDDGPITEADLQGHTPEEVKAAAKAKADEILAREGRPSTDEIAERVGDIYDRTTEEQRQAGKVWYDEAYRLAEEMVADGRTNLTLEQAAAVISHTSPLTLWAVNATIARMFAAGGSFEDAAAAAKAAGGFAMGPSWKRAAAAAGMDDPFGSFGSGANKTRDFAENIMGDKYGVTVDTHMYRVLGQLKDTTGKIEGTPQWKRSDQVYEALAQSVRIAADERGVLPSEFQATTWVWMLENFNPEREGHPANIYDQARGEEIPILIDGDLSRVASAEPAEPFVVDDSTPDYFYHRYEQLRRMGFLSGRSLTAAAPDQARAPKGSAIGGQWIDTPAGILADIKSGAVVGPGIRDTVREQGGASISPVTGKEPTDGFMVAVQGHNLEVPDDVFFGPGGEDALYGWIEQNIDALSEKGAHIGLWHDTENGEVVFDVSQRVDTIAEAIRLGKERNQQAVWDVANGEEIDTGGTGDRQPDDDSMSARGEHYDRREARLRGAPGRVRRLARGAEARVRARSDRDDLTARIDRLTTFAPAQLRAPKGSSGGIGGEWIDTPSAVLGDMKNAYGHPVTPQTIGRSGLEAPTLENNSPVYAFEGANPNYGADPEYRINCQKTTAAYEMRRRGMDVQADGGLGDHKGFMGLPMYFEIQGTSKLVDPRKQQTPGTGGMVRNVIGTIGGNYPAGSRGAISGTRSDGGGHIWNWEVDGIGDVHFIDAQSGTDVTYDMAFWEMFNGSFSVQRLDDAAIREGALDAIDNSRLTPIEPE